MSYKNTYYNLWLVLRISLFGILQSILIKNMAMQKRYYIYFFKIGKKNILLNDKYTRTKVLNVKNISNLKVV